MPIQHDHSDDLRGLFHDDTETLKRIDEMEQYVRPKYNRMIELIENGLHPVNHNDRK